MCSLSLKCFDSQTNPEVLIRLLTWSSSFLHLSRRNDNNFQQCNSQLQLVRIYPLLLSTSAKSNKCNDCNIQWPTNVPPEGGCRTFPLHGIVFRFYLPEGKYTSSESIQRKNMYWLFFLHFHRSCAAKFQCMMILVHLRNIHIQQLLPNMFCSCMKIVWQCLICTIFTYMPVI